MARKLRLEFEGAAYHVINRGNSDSDGSSGRERPKCFTWIDHEALVTALKQMAALAPITIEASGKSALKPRSPRNAACIVRKPAWITPVDWQTRRQDAAN